MRHLMFALLLGPAFGLMTGVATAQVDRECWPNQARHIDGTCDNNDQQPLDTAVVEVPRAPMTCAGLGGVTNCADVSCRIGVDCIPKACKVSDACYVCDGTQCACTGGLCPATTAALPAGARVPSNASEIPSAAAKTIGKLGNQAGGSAVGTARDAAGGARDAASGLFD